jgi:hypothetical protein
MNTFSKTILTVGLALGCGACQFFGQPKPTTKPIPEVTMLKFENATLRYQALAQQIGALQAEVNKYQTTTCQDLFKTPDCDIDWGKKTATSKVPAAPAKPAQPAKAVASPKK